MCIVRYAGAGHTFVRHSKYNAKIHGAEMREDLDTEIQKRVSYLKLSYLEASFGGFGLFACTGKSLGCVWLTGHNSLTMAGH